MFSEWLLSTRLEQVPSVNHLSLESPNHHMVNLLLTLIFIPLLFVSLIIKIGYLTLLLKVFILDVLCLLDVPEAPGKPEATAVDSQQITTTWLPPESDGGSPITGYIVEKKETSSARWTKVHRDSVTETSLVVKDLIEGKEYVFHVAAINKAGTGPFSEPSEPKITKPLYGKLSTHCHVL